MKTKVTTFQLMLNALKMTLRLIESENLDEIFDGEAETIRDAIEAGKKERN